MGHSKRYRKKKQNQTPAKEKPMIELSRIEVAFILSVIGITLLMGTFIYSNPELFKSMDIQKKAAEFSFNLELFQEKKRFFISQARLDKEFTENDPRINEAKRNYLGQTDLRLVPDKFLEKWIPDPSRFEGVQEFLERTKANGTIVEEFFYLTVPKFQKADRDILIVFPAGTQELLSYLEVEGCYYLSDCHRTEVELRDGDLYMHEYLAGRKGQTKLTRVFYVPSYELLDPEAYTS